MHSLLRQLYSPVQWHELSAELARARPLPISYLVVIRRHLQVACARVCVGERVTNVFFSFLCLVEPSICHNIFSP